MWNNYSTTTSTIGGTTSATNYSSTGYSATFTPNSGYCWPDGTTTAKTVNWMIAQAASSFTLSPTTLTLKYPATGASTFSGTNCTINTVTSSNTNTATVSKNGNTITVTPVKTGSVTITVTGTASSSNYSAPANKTITVTINPGDSSFTVSPTSLTFTLPDKTSKTSTFSGTNCSINTVTSSNTGVATVTKSGNTITVTPVAAGTATITVTGTGSTNYSNPSNKTISVTVNKSDSSFTVTPNSLTLTYPNTGTSTFAGTNCSINTVTSSNTSVATVSKNGNTITVTPVAYGTATITVTGTPTSSADYNAPANKTISVTVNRGTQTITFNPTATSGTITYPDTTKTFTATTSGNGALSVSPTSGNSIANASISNGTVTITRAGYGTTTITVTAAQTNQYNQATKTYSITCSKRTVTPTAPTLTTGALTYNGSAKTLANAGSCTAGGTMYYYVSTSSTAPTFSTSTWKTSIDTKTDAGTYYIYWYCYVSDTTNNNDTSSDDINVVKSLGSRTIGPAANGISFTTPQSLSANYNVNTQDKTFTAATGANGSVTYAIQSQKNSSNTTVSYFSIPTNSTASIRVAANAPAGTYTVVIRATAAGVNPNYSSGYKDSTFTITVSAYTVTMTKGTGISSVTYKLGSGSATTYSSAVTVPVGQTVTYSATVSSGYTWWKWTGTHASTTNAYSFTMPASNVSDTANAMQQITTPS